MTSTDSLTPSDSAQAFAELLAGLDPVAVQDWLEDRAGEMAAAIERELQRLLTAAVDRFVASLTAAGDPGAFDGVAQAWTAFVGQQVGPNLAVLHKTGQLAAILTAPTSQPMGSNQPALWDMKVIDQVAADYAKTAVSKVTGVGADVAAKIQTRIYAAVSAGRTTEQTKEAIEQLSDEISEFKADTIARTEILAAYNNGDQIGAQALGPYGPVEKVWLATSDARTRPDGTIVEAPAPPPPPPPTVSQQPAPPVVAPQGAPAAEPPTPGKKMSDAALDKWVRDQLVYDPKASASKLLAHARSQGLSVSQERMRKAVQAAKAPGGGAAKTPGDTAGKKVAGGPTGTRGARSQASTTFMGTHDHPITKIPPKDMTPESAARRYTADSSGVNRALRTTGDHQMAANLDAALKPPKLAIEVYRGAKLDVDKLPDGSVAGLQGKVFRDRGYLSTSAGADDGPAFGGNIGMRITVNDNGRGAYVQPISAFPSEREFIVARDQPLYVTTVRKPDPNGPAWEKGFQWIVEAETVTPEWVRAQGANSVWDSNTGKWAAW